MGCSGSKAVQVSTPGCNTPAGLQPPAVLQVSTLLQTPAANPEDAMKMPEAAPVVQSPKAGSESAAEAGTVEMADSVVDAAAPEAEAPVDVPPAEAADAERSQQVPPAQGVDTAPKKPSYSRAQTCPARAMQFASQEKTGIEETVEASATAEQVGDEPVYGNVPRTAGPDPAQVEADLKTLQKAQFMVDEEVAWACKGVQENEWEKVGKVQSCEFVQGEHVYEVAFTAEVKDANGDLVETNTVERIAEEDLVKVARL